MEIIVVASIFALLSLWERYKYFKSVDRLIDQHRLTLKDWNDSIARGDPPSAEPEEGSPVFIDIPEMPEELKRWSNNPEPQTEADILGT